LSAALVSKPDGSPTSLPADDGLHPTVTSDGNKFTPGTAGSVTQRASADGATPVPTQTSATVPDTDATVGAETGDETATAA
jgi:hypothetical protein